VRNILLRVLRLYAGLFTYAIGIVFTINANLGLSPWDVFSKGLSIKFHITMGHAYIFVGFVLVIVDAVFGERLGWGTILNMIFIGVFMDFLMLNHLIPITHNMAPGIVMMLLGMFITGIATYLYIGAGLGSGPRDGLMLVLTKKTRKSVRLIRTLIETSALAAGYILGGYVGMGTLIMALTTGYFVQAAFKVFKFDVKTVKHRFIDEDIKFLKEKLLGTKNIISVEEDES
jgi:uncharacterized protein